MSKIFSQRITALRKERNLLQSDVATGVGCNRSTLSGYEAEFKEPPYDLMRQFAEFFGVSVDYLVGATDERNPIMTVYPGDTRGFKEFYEASGPEVQYHAGKCFDGLYRLLGQDVQLGDEAHLRVYADLLSKLASYRGTIRAGVVQSKGGTDPAAMTTLVMMQSEFKNEVNAILDRLMQLDMTTAFDLEEKTGVSSDGMVG